MARQEMNISCPECGANGTIDIYLSINTQEEPELKEAVRDRSAFVFKCPECGAKTPVDYGFLYQEPERMLMIQYAPDDEQFNKLHEVLADPENARIQGIKNAGYTIRLVHTANELTEKLAVFDAGLDDRLIEVYKLSALSVLRKDHPDLNPAHCELMFFADEKGEQRFQIINEDKPYGVFALNEKAYSKFQIDFLGIIPDINLADPVIDRTTAMELIALIGDDKKPEIIHEEKKIEIFR